MIHLKILLLFLSVLLAACQGEGARPSESSDVINPPDGPGPNEETVYYSLSGKVAFFDLIESTVSVFDKNGIKISEGVIDTSGEVTLILENIQSQQLKLTVSGGSYTEPATGNTIYLNTQMLSTFYTFSITEDNPNFLISLSSHLQSALMENGKSKSLSKALIENYMGYAFETISSIPSLNDVVFFENFSDEAKAAAFQSGLSQLAYDLLKKEGLSTENQGTSDFTSIHLLNLAYLDLLYDAELDGEQLSGSVVIGSQTIDSFSYRTDLSLALLKFIQQAQNNSSLTITHVYDFAKAISELTPINTPLFGNNPPNPITTFKPTISNESPSDRAPILGNKTFTFEVSDSVGITEVGFTFGSKPIVYAVDVETPLFLVDTTTVSDGIYDVTLMAKNYANQISELRYEVIVTNDGTTISNLNPEQGQFVRGNYVFGADVGDPLPLNSQYFYIDSTQYTDLSQTPSGFTKSIDTSSYSDGEFSFKVEVTNTIPQTTGKTITFVIDNTLPSLDIGIEEGAFIEGNAYEISPLISDVNGIASSDFFFEGELLASDIDISAFDLDTTLYAEGNYSLSVVATDNAGNVKNETRNITIDNLAPTVVITWPVNGSTISSTSFGVIWRQVDTNGWGEVPVDLKVGGTHYSYLNNNTESHTINPYNRPAGWNVVEVIVTDASGKSVSDSINLYFDPP